jgi:hemerythrin superfamily protein
MQILQVLKKDHDEVKALLSQLASTGERAAKKRAQIFAKIKTELTAHSHAEERVFYQSLKAHDDAKDDALEGVVEHDVVERLMEEMAREPAGEETWTAKATVLKELVEHHVKEEEGGLFKKARKLFDKKALEEMGAEMKAEKKKELQDATNGAGKPRRRSAMAESRAAR